MGDPSVLCQSLGGTAGENKSCVLSPPDEKAKLQDWEHLLNFRPRAVGDEMKRRFGDKLKDPWYHAIEKGYGAVNMDFYAIQITALPVIADSVMSPELVVDYIRHNLDQFIDFSVARYAPYDVAIDGGTRWGSNPLGAIMSFQVETNVMGKKKGASVVAAECASDHWVFSTLWTPDDGGHPVSGNRQFGYRVLKAGQSLSEVYQKAGVFLNNSGGDALFFYTRGVDRVTGSDDYVVSASTDAVFAGGHACWLSLQQHVLNWILKSGGQALAAGFVSERWDWEQIRSGGLGGLWHDPQQ